MAAKSKKRSAAGRITTNRVQATESVPVPDVAVHAEPDESPLGDDLLTPRQREFVAAYVGPASLNATRAAEMAGYNANNRNALYKTAHDLLHKPNVQRAVSKALAERRLSPEWVKAGLAELAGSSMADFIGPDGNLDVQKAREAGALGQVKEWREEVIDSPGGGVTVLKRTLKLYDRRAALADLARIHGLLTERHELTGPGGGPIATSTEHKHTVDYDAIEEELRAIGRKVAGRTATDSRV
jgi:hypothetical protein